MGEVSASAILQFNNNKIHSAPKGVRCFPLNDTAIVVEWDKTADDIFTLHYVKSGMHMNSNKVHIWFQLI